MNPKKVVFCSLNVGLERAFGEPFVIEGQTILHNKVANKTLSVKLNEFGYGL